MLQQLTTVDKDKGQGKRNNRSPANPTELPLIRIKTKETSFLGITEMYGVGSTTRAFMGTNRVEMHQDRAQIGHLVLIKDLGVVLIFLFRLHKLIPGAHTHIKAKP